MSGIFLFVVMVVLVAVAALVKPKKATIQDLQAERLRQRNRIRALQVAPQAFAEDIRDAEQKLFVIDTEIERLRRVRGGFESV